VGLAANPTEPLEPVEQGGHGAGGQREPVGQLAGSELTGFEQVVHRLELGRRRSHPPGGQRVEPVVLQPEAPQRGAELSGSGHVFTQS
jgi:hypothetical protein